MPRCHCLALNMATSPAKNTRAVAARALCRVVEQGLTLDAALAEDLTRIAGAPDRGFVKELCFGALRWFDQLDFILDHYLDKPLKQKDTDIRMLVLVGLYQLHHLGTPPHAAISATVEATTDLGKTWAKALVNALLRRSQQEYERIRPEPEQHPGAYYSHPHWLLEQIRADWPQQWQSMLEANNQRPPQHLRVNLLRTNRKNYLEELDRAGIRAQALDLTTCGIRVLEPVDVNALPGFAHGLVSVQDAGAQLAAGLLDLQPGYLVLDACAAPGGKTAHILETQAQIAGITALDVDEKRTTRLRDTLHRLKLEANLMTADATSPDTWWDGRPFDRILLDAPCSATGVIRRHPDIKRLKLPAQLPALQAAQSELLATLWPLLKPGGRLVYSTCSVLKDENDRVIERFFGEHPAAKPEAIRTGWGIATKYGWQLLPGRDNTDGFYYAILTAMS